MWMLLWWTWWSTSACTKCPAPPCTAWLDVTLREDVWVKGTYRLDLEGAVDGLSCTVGVPQPAALPTTADVDCNGLVYKDGVVFDTGGTIDPTLVQVRGKVGEGLDRPSSLRLRLVHTSPSGVLTPLRNEVIPVVWTDRRPPSRTCATDCATAFLTVEAPAF